MKIKTACFSEILVSTCESTRRRDPEQHRQVSFSSRVLYVHPTDTFIGAQIITRFKNETPVSRRPSSLTAAHFRVSQQENSRFDLVKEHGSHSNIL